MYDVTWNIALISIWSPLSYLLGLMNMLKWIRRKYYESQDNPFITQEQLNKMCEPRLIDIPKKYANTTLILLVTLCYMYIFSYVPIFALVGTMIQYVAEKLVLIRYSKVPRTIGPMIAKTFVKLMPMMLFVHSTSTWYFHYRLTGDLNKSLYSIYMNLGVLVLLYAYFWLVEKQRIATVKDTYESRVLKFTWKYDYKLCNPISRRQAETLIRLLQMRIEE